MFFLRTLWNNKEKNKSKRIKLFEASNLRDFQIQRRIIYYWS